MNKLTHSAVACFFVLLANTSFAAIWFVATNSPSDGPGTSWSTAFHTIQQGVNTAASGDTVLVTNGVYDTGGAVTPGYACSNRVVITSGITVRSVNGPEFSVIKGKYHIRVAYIDAGMLIGFTLKDGNTLSSDDYLHDQSGGGALILNFGSISNCIVYGNSAYNMGGGTYGGDVYNCDIYQNSANQLGGGAAYSSLRNCRVHDNISDANGGGYSGGTIQNCAIYNNKASLHGGGLYDASAYNCTVTRNQAAFGGGIYKGHIFNTIAWFNRAQDRENYYKLDECKYCCSTPLPSGDNNIDTNPQLIDCAHISSTSPCLGRGSNAYRNGTVDIDGELFPYIPPIGCDVVNSSALTGTIHAAIIEDGMDIFSGHVRQGHPLTFYAAVTGKVSSIIWNFGDGTSLTNQYTATHSWHTPGNYTLTLTTVNNTTKPSVSQPVTVYSPAQSTYYVDAASTLPIAPYTNWATAAKAIQDAVDAAESQGIGGAEVLVANGEYNSGGKRDHRYHLTNRVTVTKDIVIRSVNGPENTLIVGQGPIGSSAVRCLYMKAGTVSGFTITNGNTLASYGNDIHDTIGAGLNAEGGIAHISNCIFIANSSSSDAPAMYCGIADNCTFITNTAQYGRGTAEYIVGSNCIFRSNYTQTGSGVGYSILYDSTIYSNRAYYAGAGAYQSTLYRCCVSNNASHYGDPQGNGGGLLVCDFYDGIIVGNTGNGYGGGAYNCNISNSVIRGNTAAKDGGGVCAGTLHRCLLENNTSMNSFGGGAASATLYNCLIISNSVEGFIPGPPDIPMGNGGGAGNCTLYNCTIAGNHANDGGGGTSGGTLYNCIIRDNHADSTNDNWSGGTFYNCCTTPNPGGANIEDDPLFMNPASGNFHLRVYSPCVDQGTNLAGTVDIDLDGVARPIDGRLDGGSEWDIGCYEYDAYQTDSDGDSMSDGWEYTHTLDPTNAADATANPDGDPANNMQEYTADTDPHNSNEFFRVTAISNTTSVTVYFNSSGNRIYSMQRSTNLISGTWNNVPGAGPVNGNGGQDSLSDTNHPAQGLFYRLKVAIP